MIIHSIHILKEGMMFHLARFVERDLGRLGVPRPAGRGG